MSTHNIPFSIYTQNYSKSAAMGSSSKGLKNKFETAMVNKPSVFEPLKVYCVNEFSKSVGHNYIMSHLCKSKLFAFW